MGRWNVKDGPAVQRTPVTRERFLRHGPDLARRSFVALALGSAAPVIMPFETAAADDSGTTPDGAEPSDQAQADLGGSTSRLVPVVTPCAGDITWVLPSSSEVQAVLTPVELVATEKAARS